jgi:Spy/CpxP family protein refolding chaperone
MRKTLLILAAAVAFTACDSDTTGPGDTSLALDEASILGYTGSFAADPAKSILPGVHGLPENLKLTAAQQAAIRALHEAFMQANRADFEALAAIMRQARDAHQAGKSKEEIKAILDQAAPIRTRLMAAEAKLRTDILAVLTAEQRAWLEANRPQPCTPPQLTESQKNEISALIAAFQQANQADLETIRNAVEQARAAHKNGASREEIARIMQGAQAAMQRVRAAEQALRAAIEAVLTPEQKAAACRPHAGPPGPGPDKRP